jgi:hypothetical protein
MKRNEKKNLKPNPGGYLIDTPLKEVGASMAEEITGHTTPTLTYLCDKQVPGVTTYIEFGWIWEMPTPNPHIHEHVHAYDEVVMHIGSESARAEELGGEIEFVVGGEPIIINKTSAIFIPKGVKHGPLTWKKVTRPHIQMAVILGTGNMESTNVGGYPI